MAYYGYIMEEGEQQNNGDNAPYLTISELSRAVKTAVENAFDFVRVRAGFLLHQDL